LVGSKFLILGPSAATYLPVGFFSGLAISINLTNPSIKTTATISEILLKATLKTTLLTPFRTSHYHKL